MRYGNDAESAIRNRAAALQTRNMQENRNDATTNARTGYRIDRAMNNMLRQGRAGVGTVGGRAANRASTAAKGNSDH